MQHRNRYLTGMILPLAYRTINIYSKDLKVHGWGGGGGPLAGANWGDLRIWQIWRRQGPTNPSIPLTRKGPLPNHTKIFFAEHSKPNWRCMQGKIKENTEYRRLHSLELHEFQIHLIEISLSSSYSADVRPITPLVTHSEEISPRVNVNV